MTQVLPYSVTLNQDPRIRQGDILDKTVILMLVLLTGGIHFVILGNLMLLPFYSLILLLLVIRRTLRFRKTDLNIFVIVTTGMLLFLIANYLFTPPGKNISFYILFFFKFVFLNVLFLYVRASGLNFISIFIWVLKVITIHALFSFLLGFLVGPFLITISTPKIETNTFLGLFFYQAKFSLGPLEIFRNQGLFWEPGILQLYLNILFLLAYHFNLSGRWQLLTGFLILTTQSTTGLAIFFLLLIGLNIRYLRKLHFVLPFIPVATAFGVLLYYNLINKIEGEGVGSFALRFYDFTMAYDILKMYPLLGIGYDPQTYFDISRRLAEGLIVQDIDFTALTAERGNSNSVLIALVQNGLLFMTLILIAGFRQTLIPRRGIFFTILVVGNLSEPLLFYYFFLFIIISGFWNLVNSMTSKNTSQ